MRRRNSFKNSLILVYQAGDKMFTLETIKSSPNHVVWSEIDQSQFEDVEPKMEAEDTMEVDIMRTETMERELMRGAEDKTARWKSGRGPEMGMLLGESCERVEGLVISRKRSITMPS